MNQSKKWIRFKSNNYKGSNREMSFIALALQYWKKGHFDTAPKYILHFWGTNNIFADCTPHLRKEAII